MFNLPKRNTQDKEQYAKEMEKKREAFISQAPLKETPPATNQTVNTTESKTEFADFKIKKPTKPKGRTKPKMNPEKTLKNKIDTYVSDDVLKRFNELCQKEQRTQAAMLRIILMDYMESNN